MLSGREGAEGKAGAEGKTGSDSKIRLFELSLCKKHFHRKIKIPIRTKIKKIKTKSFASFTKLYQKNFQFASNYMI